MQGQSEETYAPTVQREPSPEEYDRALKTVLPMVNKADVIKAQFTSLNNDGYQDYVVLYYNGESTTTTNLEIFTKDIDNSFRRDFTDNGRVKNFEIRDLDNDGLLEVVTDTYYIYPPEGLQGLLSTIKFQNGEYHFLHQVSYHNDIKIKDIDKLEAELADIEAKLGEL